MLLVDFPWPRVYHSLALQGWFHSHGIIYMQIDSMVVGLSCCRNYVGRQSAYINLITFYTYFYMYIDSLREFSK